MQAARQDEDPWALFCRAAAAMDSARPGADQEGDSDDAVSVASELSDADSVDSDLSDAASTTSAISDISVASHDSIAAPRVNPYTAVVHALHATVRERDEASRNRAQRMTLAAILSNLTSEPSRRV